MPLRVLVFLVSASVVLAQQPILYNRGTVNAASLAPFGLPNAPIARGSIFTVLGENLGPAQSQTVSSFPLATTFGGVSLSVTHNGVTTQAIPLTISATKINAVMPSSVTAGLATLRLTYQGVHSNAITIQIADSAPGIFTVSNDGAGPGTIQNFIAGDNQPINSLTLPAARGQLITIWGTGLGPVTFPDNTAPRAGDVAAPVEITIGGRPAKNLYSGRSPCCSGIDQIVTQVPDGTPLGCWVPVVVKAGAVVSNTATMAIAAPGASSCDDAGNPLSKLVRTPGTQAFIHIERVDSVENVNSTPGNVKTLDNIYTRFYTRPNSPYNFDPYLSYPPAGTCLVHQAPGDSAYEKTLRGVLPASASLNPQPNQVYSNGTQPLPFTPNTFYFASTLGGTINSIAGGMSLIGASGTFTIDPDGANQKVIPFASAAAPGWVRPNGILVIPRNVPFALAFTPGDPAAPTAILLYSYAAGTNSTVEVQCLATAGANTFTIPADTLANLPPTYGILDGSYADLVVGTLQLNKAVSFTNALAANGILLTSSWLSQTVVLQ